MIFDCSTCRDRESVYAYFVILVLNMMKIAVKKLQDIDSESQGFAVLYLKVVR